MRVERDHLVTLLDALPHDRERLRRLLADYLFEFDGREEPYPYLDAYWREPERLPLLIEADRRLVGFCLIRRRRDGWSVAEFSVVPGARRMGIGRRAVHGLALRAVEAGAKYIEATILPGHEVAERFWHGVGFHTVASRKGATVTRRDLLSARDIR